MHCATIKIKIAFYDFTACLLSCNILVNRIVFVISLYCIKLYYVIGLLRPRESTNY